MNHFSIQTITRPDEVLSIQNLCYGSHYHEHESVIFTRMQTSPQTHWLGYHQQQPVSYLIGYFSQKGCITPFNTAFQPVLQPECFYIHDMAVRPDYRGRGVSGKMLAYLYHAIKQQGISVITLVAVQGVAPFWQRQGFHGVTQLSAAQTQNLRSYGANAVYMMKIVDYKAPR